jgi:hypothetical protein
MVVVRGAFAVAADCPRSRDELSYRARYDSKLIDDPIVTEYVNRVAGYGLYEGLNIAIPLTYLKFSHNADREADFLGVQYVYEAGLRDFLSMERLSIVPQYLFGRLARRLAQETHGRVVTHF